MSHKELRVPVVIEVFGKKVFGVLHRPDVLEKVPAVLVCHGLAGNKVGKYRAYVKLAEALVQSGIAALRIDFRGLGDSEGDFSATTPKTKVQDALAALDYLARHHAIDPKCIGIFGRSFGGTVALEAGAQYSKVKSIVIWAPLFDASEWREIWHKYLNGQVTRKELQIYSKIDGQELSLEFLQELFALDLEKTMPSLKEIPLLHIQGDKDEVIPNSHTFKFEKARQLSYAKTKFIRLNQSDHAFSIEDERSRAIQETVLWFSSTLSALQGF